MKRLNLNRLRERFIVLVEKYLRDHGMEQQVLAEIVGIDPVVLSYLLNRRRTLTAHYLQPFLTEGILMKDEIYDGHSGSEKENEFWKIATVLQKKSLLLRIAHLVEIGGDPEEAVEREISTIERIIKK